jgi:hypothetical protein
VSGRRPRRPRTPGLPLEYRWHESLGPLPLRPVRRATAARPPDHSLNGTPGQALDFCARVRRLLEDIVARCPELGHVRVPRLLLGVTQARSPRVHGLQARVTPLRFAGGTLTRERRGHVYQVQRYFLGAHEFLYLMTFCLPRFLDQDFDEKLITLFHELYHISPRFDGDLRRHDGRYQLHTRRQCDYDRQMAELARIYLAHRPDPDLLAFLRLNFAQLQERHGAVLGIVVPRPKIIPVRGAGRAEPVHVCPQAENDHA